MKHSVRKIAALSLTLVAVAACSSTSSPTTTSSVPTPTDTATAPSSSPTDTTSSAAPTTSSTGTGSATSANGACSAANTSIAMGTVSAAAGSVFYTFKVTNTGPADCTTTGFPGVSLVAPGAGDQIGAAATRDTTATATTVTLASGASTSFVVSVGQAGNYDAAECKPTKADAFRLYLPGDKAAQSVKASNVTGCAATSIELLRVRPVGASAG